MLQKKKIIINNNNSNNNNNNNNNKLFKLTFRNKSLSAEIRTVDSQSDLIIFL